MMRLTQDEIIARAKANGSYAITTNLDQARWAEQVRTHTTPRQRDASDRQAEGQRRFDRRVFGPTPAERRRDARRKARTAKHQAMRLRVAHQAMLAELREQA